jgi:ubiquinone/menaquinone biosynthesis C-methylase UbiE
MSPIKTGRALLDPEKIFRKTGLEVGMTYADFGCGSLGHFVFPAASMVTGKGKVYAVDILKSAISAIKSRIKLESITNIETVWGDIEKLNGVRIPDNSCDFVSVINVAGLIKKSPTVLEEVKRVVKSGGTLLVIGWEPAGASFGPDPQMRIGEDEAKSIVVKADYQFVKSIEAGPYHWGLVFKES